MKASTLIPPAHGGRKSEDSASLESLRISLGKHKQLQPIVIRRNGEVIIGERRRQALGNNEAAVIELDVDEVEALEIRLSDELAKSDMSAVERGEAFRDYIVMIEAKEGKRPTHREVASRVGCTDAQVSFYVSLARLPEPVKEMAKEGRLTTLAAEALTRRTDLQPTEQVQLARKFADEKAPSGHKAREVVHFVTTAPEPVRRDFLENPRTTYEEAQRAAEREAARQRREEVEDRTAMRAAPFFRKVTAKMRDWSRALSSIIDLASEVPVQQRTDVRQAVINLRDQCDCFLSRIEGERTPAPAGLLDRAEQEWE